MSLPNVKHADAALKLHLQNRATRNGVAFGQRMELDDGRKFRFVLNGAALQVVGDLIQGPAVITGDYTDIVVDVLAAVDATTVSVTPTTATAANTYAEGTMHVNKHAAGTGGQVYRIDSHVLFAASSGKVITLESYDPLQVALAVNDEVGFLANPYDGVLQAIQTTVTNRVVGVACAPITAAQYGWVQTGGIAAVNSAASQLVGNTLYAVLAAAGRVGVGVVDIDQLVGYALSVPTTAGEWGAIFLTMD